MTEETNQTPTPNAYPVLGADAVSPSRRRLLLSAGAAAPVVLTMVSMPAHAQVACINPSGFISAATYASRHPTGVPPICTTKGPNYWLTQYRASASHPGWPTTAPNTTSSKFSTIFGGTPLTNDPKLWEVLTGKLGVVYSDFAKYCVAAYLNSRTGVANFPLTTSRARGLYVAITGVGSLPAGAVRPAIPLTNPVWDEAKAVLWLKTVMG